jgi:[protein-PII] uridylyltransferase
MTERPAPVARLLDELSALDRAYSPGHHGRWSAARRAELVDGCLRELFEGDERPSGATLVALGGYGRGELAPGSDIDLLVVHDGSEPERIAALAERLLYPLWDAGIRVGHGVRTPQECEALAAERLDAATAMLDGRPLAGDAVAWAEALARVLAPIRGDPQAFVRGLRADAEDRGARYGAVSSLLEPDLKEGSGGLRDLHALGWLRTAIGRPLEDAGLLRARERDALDAAWEFLVRVRSALHLQTGRAIDRLFLDHQPGLARDLGFSDEPGLRAVDGLMRQVFEHARQVEHTPEGVLRALAEVSRGGVVAPDTLDAIEAVDVPAEVGWTNGVREAFLALLRAGEEGARMLEILDRLDLLRRYVPEWSLVRCRPQRDPYHRFPVDVHLLRTHGAMARLLRDPVVEPMAAEAAALIADRDGVLLGALFHDIGKTGGRDHVATGREIAARALGRMGLSPDARELAHFMVSEHLLLPDIATRRDLEDDDLVVDVASRVGDPGRLAALYLLAIADAEATGPLAWTPWRATLVRELVAKVQRVLERGEVGADTAARLAERADAVRDALVDEDPAAIDRFILRLPRGYLLTVPAERISRQYQLIAPPLSTREVRTVAGPGARPGTYALTVVAADRPGLLSLIAGALSLAGLSILSAQVFTTADGVAVDLFEVEGAFEVDVGEDRWREFRAALRKAIEGRISLALRVREKRRFYPPARHEVPVRISADNDVSDFFTVVEVGAPDRIGLLFDVTRTLSEFGLDVHIAKVATYGARVVDAFYVRDELGRKLDDPERIDELGRALRTRIEEPGTGHLQEVP